MKTEPEKKNEAPRRSRLYLNTTAELAIYNALQEVEKMPADIRLTDTVILLGQAKDKVADFVDSEKGKLWRMSKANPV